MIETSDLTKRYRRTTAVDGLSVTVRPGRVTGFLGPNGAGKSTTLRLVLGLDAPTRGTATIGGRPYRRLAAPLREVGALLDARSVHGGRTAAEHLAWVARSNGIDRRRVRAVLDLVGLAAVADRPAGGFSLGMGQRLGIAVALLGDPATLILDEPVNGLDTEGIRWVRELVRGLAAEGRTVLLSSHLMSEMELTADHLVVLGRGRLLADLPMRAFIERNSLATTIVRSPDGERLAALVRARGGTAEPEPEPGPGAGSEPGPGPGAAWRVRGLDAAAVGALAHAHGLVLHELSPRYPSLEEVYTRMTAAAVEYPAAAAGTGEGR